VDLKLTDWVRSKVQRHNREVNDAKVGRTIDLRIP
jgi:hypothetical protein